MPPALSGNSVSLTTVVREFGNDAIDTSAVATVRPIESRQIAGLDALRLVAALWVCFFHGARLPLAELYSHPSWFELQLISVNNAIYNGVAAVMLFFVVSGMVIHFPNIGTGRLALADYYVRRLSELCRLWWLPTRCVSLPATDTFRRTPMCSGACTASSPTTSLIR